MAETNDQKNLLAGLNGFFLGFLESLLSHFLKQSPRTTKMADKKAEVVEAVVEEAPKKVEESTTETPPLRPQRARYISRPKQQRTKDVAEFAKSRKQ